MPDKNPVQKGRKPKRITRAEYDELIALLTAVSKRLKAVESEFAKRGRPIEYEFEHSTAPILLPMPRHT